MARPHPVRRFRVYRLHKPTSSSGRGKAKIELMRIKFWLILIVQAALVVLLAVAVKRKLIPLGVPGEWEWLRVAVSPTWLGLVLVSLAVAAYAGFVALGWRSLASRTSRRFEAAWLIGLLIAATGVQVMIPMGAPEGYDLAKWAAVNYVSGSTGYFQIARKQAVRDPWRFLAEYPEWIRSQDSLHIGTHPPGLIVAQCLLMHIMEQHPALADSLLNRMPATVELGFRAFSGYDPRPLTRAERAGLYATALLTLIACAGTVVPLYLLARVSLPAPGAWAAAALWPLAPAANLFQPVADTAYPLLSTTALAMACWAARFQQGSHRPTFAGTILAAASGIVMALGMAFTLAFLPVGLIVALAIGLNFGDYLEDARPVNRHHGARFPVDLPDRMGCDRGRPTHYCILEPPSPRAIL